MMRLVLVLLPIAFAKVPGGCATLPYTLQWGLRAYVYPVGEVIRPPLAVLPRRCLLLRA